MPLRSYIEGDTLAQRAVNFLSAFREVKALALAVTLTNIGGVAYGVYFYWDQLNATAWYLLPFVPDSPTGPFLMVIVYGLWWFRGRRRSPTLELLAFVELIKFGVWTVIIFWIYRAEFFAPARAQLTNTLLILHLAEALEAGVLLKGFRAPKLLGLGGAGAWLAAGDFSDYVLGTHPRLPAGVAPGAGAELVPSITVALTIICFLTAILAARRQAAARSTDPPPQGADDHDSTPPPP